MPVGGNSPQLGSPLTPPLRTSPPRPCRALPPPRSRRRRSRGRARRAAPSRSPASARFLLRRRRAVVIAEDADQRAGEVLGHVDRRDRRLRVELFLAHHDAAAPQLGAGIDILFLARIDEGVAAAGAGAEQADLAVVVCLR